MCKNGLSYILLTIDSVNENANEKASVNENEIDNEKNENDHKRNKS